MILERLLLAGTGLKANSISTVFKQKACMKKKKKKKNRQKVNSRTNVHSRMHISFWQKSPYLYSTTCKV